MLGPAKLIRSLGLCALMLTVLESGAVQAQALPTSDPLAARGGDEPTGKHLSVGLGAGSMGTGETGIAFQGALTMPRGSSRLLMVRGAGVTEFNIFGPSPAESVWDIGVLYGIRARSKWGYVQASAGVAVVGGMRRGERITPPVECNGDLLGCIFLAALTPVEYESKPFHTLGIPVEIEAGFNLFQHVGLGVSAWADVNGRRAMTGASVGLVVGSLR